MLLSLSSYCCGILQCIVCITSNSIRPVNVMILLCWFFPQMGQVNPMVSLCVVTLDGSSVTAVLRPPDSFEKRYILHRQEQQSCGYSLTTSLPSFWQ